MKHRKRWTIAVVLVIALVTATAAYFGSQRSRSSAPSTSPTTFAPASYPKGQPNPNLQYWCTPPKGSRLDTKQRTAIACWTSTSHDRVRTVVSISGPFGTKASCGPALLPFPHVHCWLVLQPGSVTSIAAWMDRHPGFSSAAFTALASATCGLLTVENPPLSIIMAAACGIYAAFYGSVFEHTVHSAATYKGNNGSGAYPLCVGAGFDLYYWTGTFPQGMKIKATGAWGWHTVWINGVDYQRWLNSDTRCSSFALQPGMV